MRAKQVLNQLQTPYLAEPSDYYVSKSLNSVHSMHNLKREGLNIVELLPVLTKRKDEQEGLTNAFRSHKSPLKDFKEKEKSKYLPKNIIGNVLYSSGYHKS